MQGQGGQSKLRQDLAVTHFSMPELTRVFVLVAPYKNGVGCCLPFVVVGEQLETLD